MKVMIEGYSTLIGSPAAILSLMQEARIFEEPKSGDEYIKQVSEDMKRGFDIDLHITGNTLNDRAESLLRELAKNEMITIEEE